MAVKPVPGETIEEVKRTRVIGSGVAKEASEESDLWEYVEALNEADWASGGYRFTIERGRPEWKSEDRVFVARIAEKITPEEIAKRWGGGDYTIWFKIPPKGQQLKFKKLLRIDGAPLPNGTAPAVGTGGGSFAGAAGSNDPIIRMLDMMERRFASLEQKFEQSTGIGANNDAVKQAVLLTGDVFRAATTAATGTLQGIAGGNNGGAASSPMMEMQMMFMKAMIEKMINPPQPTDPIKTFGDMMAAIKGLGILNAGGPAQSPWTAIGVQAIQAIPTAISEASKGLELWSRAEEMRYRTAALQRGQNPEPINVRPQPAAHPPAPAPVAAAPPPPQAEYNPDGGAQDMNLRQLEAVETGLVNILNNQTLSIDEAANAAASMIQSLMPGAPEALANSGEAELLKLFQQRPILARGVPQNPRLTEFIKKFIEVVGVAPIAMQAQPPNVPPA